MERDSEVSPCNINQRRRHHGPQTNRKIRDEDIMPPKQSEKGREEDIMTLKQSEKPEKKACPSNNQKNQRRKTCFSQS